MSNCHDQQIIKLTITLNAAEFDLLIQHGLYCLRELGEMGVVQPHMPVPDTFDKQRDVAIFGVQEMIATCVDRSRSAPSEDEAGDDAPF